MRLGINTWYFNAAVVWSHLFIRLVTLHVSMSKLRLRVEINARNVKTSIHRNLFQFKYVDLNRISSRVQIYSWNLATSVVGVLIFAVQTLSYHNHSGCLVVSRNFKAVQIIRNLNSALIPKIYSSQAWNRSWFNSKQVGVADRVFAPLTNFVVLVQITLYEENLFCFVCLFFFNWQMFK